MKALNWHLLLLQDNPFSVTPPQDTKDVKWAGMPELKEEIEQKLFQARLSAITQVILCRGPLGGGKTHAMLYYTLLNHWPVVLDPNVRDIFVIPVQLPRETGKADKDFYTDVLERIGMPQIRQAVTKALQEVGEQTGLITLQKITGSESLGKAICMLGSSYDPVQNDLIKLNTHSERELLLDSYFLDGCTKAELRKLGLARNIDKAQDRFRILAGLFHCLIGLSPDNNIARHNRVCLWIDELEDLIYYTSAQFRPFTQGLRDLVDHIPNFFSMWMNMTLTEPSESYTIEVLMGKPLVDRITDHIIFREMTLSQGLQYVQELMRLWRTQQPEDLGLSPLYPFEEDALRYLIENLDKRTPRSINERCRSVLMIALREEEANDRGQISINLNFVKGITRLELDKEME
ncbi:MAG TPA: hypothetical protein VEP90_18305 [Methylomirabilota bacterium]|nr:hypothetical protein [Methylomirabilota bacterium]